MKNRINLFSTYIPKVQLKQIDDYAETKKRISE